MPPLGVLINPTDDLQAAVRQVQLAEELGYESAWITGSILRRDPFLVLAAYTNATSRIGFGTAIVTLYPRHPVTMAQEALTLQELSGGRLRLGIGVSHTWAMVEMLGLEMGRPLAVQREYATVVRQALRGKAKFEGEHFKVNWTYGVSPPPSPPALILAALSPKALEEVGELADGVVLWLATPEYTREVVLPRLRAGREKAGLSLEGYEIIAPVPAIVTDDVEAGWRELQGELVRYLDMPFYRTAFEHAGFGHEVAAYLSERDRGSPAEAVPMRLARALGVVGSADEVRDYIEQFRAAGATLPVLRPFSPAVLERTMRALAGA